MDVRDYKESWTIKKAKCQRIDAFELWCWRRLENPLDCKQIKPANPKGNKSWIFIGRTDAEAETPILWPPDAKNWLIGKDPDSGKDWRQEEMGMTEDEMVGWHHQLDGHEVGQALGVGDGQGSLACCSPWSHKELDTPEWLNWTEYSFFFSFIFISWRLINLQYCSGFCHTLTWISHGFTCVPHPHPPSHLPLHPIPLALASAPGPSTCLMHPTWAGDLFHPR